MKIDLVANKYIIPVYMLYLFFFNNLYIKIMKYTFTYTINLSQPYILKVASPPGRRASTLTSSTLKINLNVKL